MTTYRVLFDQVTSLPRGESFVTHQYDWLTKPEADDLAAHIANMNGFTHGPFQFSFRNVRIVPVNGPGVAKGPYMGVVNGLPAGERGFED